MDLIELRDYCLSLGEVTEKTPFGKFAPRFESLLVFYVSDHMFCITDMEDFTSVTLPLAPEKAVELEERYSAVTTPVNRALKNWKQIDFYGDVPDKLIYDLLTESYSLIKEKYKRRSKG